MEIIRCNICGSKDYRILFENKDRLHKIDAVLFNVVKCSNCGLVYLNPQPTPEELKRYYPENYGPYQANSETFKFSPLSIFLKGMRRLIKNKIKKPRIIDRSVKNYLDFGCGGGSHLERIKILHPNWNLYGLDNNEVACKETQEKGFKVFCGDVLEMDLPESFFDIVNMKHVIEHLNDPKGTLEKINKTMKNGGEIIISTPNFNSWTAKLFRSHWYALDTPRHLFLFTIKTLTMLLHKTRFSIQRVEYSDDSKIAIKSFYYLRGRDDLEISPITWRILNPFSKVLSLFGRTSIVTVRAKK